IEKLVREHEGKMCIGLYRRPDGTYLTDNCPIGLRRLRRGLAKLTAGFAACFATLLCNAGVVGRSEFALLEKNLRDCKPFSIVYDWLWPGQRGTNVEGNLVVSPRPPRSSVPADAGSGQEE